MDNISLFKRWFAIFIENLIMMAAMIIPNFIMGIGIFNESGPVVITGIVLYFVFLIAFIVVQIRFWAKGSSIGKKIMKIKVVRYDTKQPLSLGEMMLREIIGKWISSIFMIGYILAFFDPEQRALHDKIVNSIVVSDDSSLDYNNY